MNDLAVTIYALTRVLHHLSEDEQAKLPKYAVSGGRLLRGRLPVSLLNVG